MFPPDASPPKSVLLKQVQTKTMLSGKPAFRNGICFSAVSDAARRRKPCFRVTLTSVSSLNNQTVKQRLTLSLRKEVIQPHLPIRLPCYDFTPVIEPAFGSSLLAVGSLTSGIPNSHGVTGGVYKTRERIHRGILIRDY